MSAQKGPPATPEHIVDDSGHPRILSPIDIFIDNEAATPELFTIAFIFSLSTTESPKSLLLSRGPGQAPGHIWVEADDPEHGFHATGVRWKVDGLLLTLELTDGHTFHWNGSTTVTVELMESRARGVNSCLGQIFAEPDPGITALLKKQDPGDHANLER
ncbi:hypothetical protein [Corynebacterium sp. A21]|uniref:hypothetical protein n=1 Tax=Corynebacterium sp. A21 TaxID=3457318 RepID=UPI003FCFD488